MGSSSEVTAVIVTYNRKQLLKRCLDALCSQDVLPDMIVVIDNASTDGTDELFSGHTEWQCAIDHIRLDGNRGGAGGFKEGLRYASRTDSKWYWIMDDDVVPKHDALSSLLEATSYLAEHQIFPSFLASHVSGAKGEVMNVPNISDHLSQNGYPDWSEHLPAGLVRISSATFVSLLISAQSVEQVGLPIADYFLWGDDIEYTKRLTSYVGPAFVCGASQVTHMRKDARPIDIAKESDVARIANHRRRIRNDLINAGYYGGYGYACRRIVHHTLDGVKTLLSKDAHKTTKARTICGGILDYLARRYNLEDLNRLDRRTMERH